MRHDWANYEPKPKQQPESIWQSILGGIMLVATIALAYLLIIMMAH
jgi:hypothetical protein